MCICGSFGIFFYLQEDQIGSMILQSTQFYAQMSTILLGPTKESSTMILLYGLMFIYFGEYYKIKDKYMYFKILVSIKNYVFLVKHKIFTSLDE
jgi:hypothetical protein